MSSYSGNNEMERTNWPNKLEYHLSMFSYVLGLVSFWRFPYMAYDNGGAPFVYVFLLLHILVGIPFVFLEMAWGQFGNLAPLQVFRIVPAMQGIGVCMLILSCLLLLYFGIASYYFLLYLASSFSSALPWTNCNNTWNTFRCQINAKSKPCFDLNNNATQQFCNDSGVNYHLTPAVEFWKENIVRNASVCSNFDSIDSVLIGSNSNVLVSPIIILACFVAGRLLISNIAMANHVRFTGKIAYLLSIVPFAVLVLLLVRCVTLEGSIQGLRYLFVPSDIKMLTAPKVWKDACGQVLLSAMASCGGLVTWSSYNRFYNKYHVDASLLIVIVPLLSLLSAASVFAVAGHLTWNSAVHVTDAFSDVAASFPALVAYSEALSQMWGDILPWSIAIFSTLFLSSSLALFPFLECILSCLSDSVSVFRRLAFRNLALFVLLILSLCAFYGIPCFLEGTGLQIIEFFDAFSLPMSLMMVGLIEMLMICYAFGFQLLYTNTKAMTGSRCLSSHFWTFLWGVFAPLVVAACLAFTVYGIVNDIESMGCGNYPNDMKSAWGHIAGGVLVGFLFLIIVLVAVVKVFQSRGSCTEKFRIAFAATPSYMSGNGRGSESLTNGNLFMSSYAPHREPAREVLIDEDIVTTV